ncbi:MAG: hypothetical protein O2782_11825 [bacterium]|nr:hypothetical protein [bacterium]
MNPDFAREWRRKVRKVRGSAFWQTVSTPPQAPVEPARERPRRGEIALDNTWSLQLQGDIGSSGAAARGAQDLRDSLARRLGVRLRRSGDGPCIALRLHPGSMPADRWSGLFTLHVTNNCVEVVAASEVALLRACLWLSNYMCLRRNAHLPLGRRRVRPLVDLHVGADLWGGFSTTQGWIHGREGDDSFLELARVGVNAVPIMTVLEDYLIPGGEGPFGQLGDPGAAQNRRRLKKLARAAAASGVHVMLMGYNPKLEPDDPFFRKRPRSRGALQAGGAFRTLCTSDPATRRFLADSWASLFEQIPELGGIITITGGEGFYHCFMRSASQAADCPRCGQRHGPEVVAEFVNDVARSLHRAQPEARLTTWPYSANHWSGDRDQDDYIAALDPEHVIFQSEIDKDSVDWREAGYAKDCWDYSMSRITPSDRIVRQRALCKQRGLPFSTKLEINTSIECLNVPYLPTLENQRAIWENARRLRPQAIHSRWLFDGANKSPAEDLGYWLIWGRGTEFEDLDHTLTAIAQRDFGARAARRIRQGWALCSAGMRHHPQLDYYKGPFFIGPGQPLVLDAVSASGPDVAPECLDEAFFGIFYWHWENAATHDATTLIEKKPLFYGQPFFRALARRGPRQGQDVALEELQELARLWELGADRIEAAAADVPRAARLRYQRECTLVRFLALTWRSAARVEEFLRLRNVVLEHSGRLWVRAGHLTENLRDVAHMERLARAEWATAKQALLLVQGVDFLDLSLRLDMGTVSTEQLLAAKVAQVDNLLTHRIPAWRQQLQTW